MKRKSDNYNDTRSTKPKETVVVNDRAKTLFKKFTTVAAQTDRLTRMCHGDLNVCVSIGMFAKRINRFIDKIRSFSHIERCDKTNLSGDNGQIYRLTSRLFNLKATTILKSLQEALPMFDTMPDNLVYEYIIGSRINSFTRTPNTVLTLGLWKYRTEETYETLLSRPSGPIEVELLNDAFVKIPIVTPDVVRDSCNYPSTYALELMYVANSLTLRKMLATRNIHHAHFMSFYLRSTLFQVYAFLRMYQNVFTHRDLNLTNVMLTYIPGHYFKFRYDTHNGILEFDSVYLVKIIDYGRSYVSGVTEKMHDMLCREKQCDPRCGATKGYNTMNIKRNKSKDLRLLLDLNDSFGYMLFDDTLNNGLRILSYNESEENTESNYPDSIRNVNDAFDFLFNATTTSKKRKNDVSEKLHGTFYINTESNDDFRYTIN